MALIVEDGTGLSNSDAFVSLAECDTYHSLRGNSSWSGADSDKEAAIRRATFHLTYSPAWAGTKLLGRAQALAWPRYGVYDGEGLEIPSDSLPIELVHATCEVALREFTSPGSMDPDVTITERTKREKIGPIEVEYTTSSTRPDDSQPILLVVDDLIRDFLTSTRRGSKSLVGVIRRV